MKIIPAFTVLANLARFSSALGIWYSTVEFGTRTCQDKELDAAIATANVSSSGQVLTEDCQNLLDVLGDMAAGGFWNISINGDDGQSDRWVPLKGNGTCHFALCVEEHTTMLGEASGQTAIYIGAFDTYSIVKYVLDNEMYSSQDNYVRPTVGNMSCRPSHQKPVLWAVYNPLDDPSSLR